MIMTKKAKYNTKVDYNPALVSLNAERLSKGLTIITEGSPEYENIMKRLKNEAAAKRIIGLSAINTMAEEYNTNGEKSLIPQGGYVMELWKSAEIAKTNKKDIDV